MKHNYTLNLIIKYLYKEIPTLKKLELENAIDDNKDLRKEFVDLKSAFRSLPKVSFYPSDKSLKSILDYSKLSSLNPSF